MMKVLRPTKLMAAAAVAFGVLTLSLIHICSSRRRKAKGGGGPTSMRRLKRRPHLPAMPLKSRTEPQYE